MHIGEKIKFLIKQKGMTVTEFSKRINYSRRNVYTIFSKSSIDTSILKRIGEVLEYDFFSYYSTEGMDVSKVNEKNTFYDSNQLKSLKDKIDALEKEVAYLKEINKLLQEKKNN